MKMDLLTNATVVDDAIRFASQKSKDKENLESLADRSEDDKESNEHDYHEDEDQLEEKQEEETREIAGATTMTINQVFRQ
jgi:hypothetical protein